jgi:hypothetical protein
LSPGQSWRTLQIEGTQLLVRGHPVRRARELLGGHPVAGPHALEGQIILLEYVLLEFPFTYSPTH